MTLVISVITREAIWLLTDRRLSFSGRPDLRIDDAVKLVLVEAIDGHGLVGYAGLGGTGQPGMQPSQWVVNVLRGRAGLTFEQSLGVIFDAGRSQFPRWLDRVQPGSTSGHLFLVPAFVEKKPRLYVIGIGPDGRGGYSGGYRQIVLSPDGYGPPMPVALAGSGGQWLDRRSDAWRFRKKILGLAKANARGKVSDGVVAHALAAANQMVSAGVADGSVGPRSLVAWRKLSGGGGFMTFDGSSPDPDSFGLPTVSKGTDIGAIVGAFNQSMKFGEDPPDGPLLPPVIDYEKLNEILKHLPESPDERFR